jgi:tRNA-specific 2-thiouridylase
VRCNERIKFGVLLERAVTAGATHVATGHYAQRGRRGDAWTLHRSADTRKDQSYTLHRLNQAQLARAVFPLGALAAKTETRRLAEERGLITARKAESQDLCFVDGGIRVELERRLAGRFTPGEIVDTTGQTLGMHRGLPFYTVGQRSGLGLAPDGSNAAPLYVLAIDARENRIVVGPKERLQRTRLVGRESTWVAETAPPAGLRVTAQLRAHGEPQPAVVTSVTDAATELVFDPAVELVSPGQPVVIAVADEILGGAIVASAA